MMTNEMILALIGGVLIGLAATILLLFNGKIAGNSGMIASLVNRFRGGEHWRGFFLLGLLAGTVVYRVLFPDTFEITVDASLPAIILGGLLVGFGTRLGNGCTAGHGVCGIARFSKRSIVATCVFMAAGILTVYLTRHVVGGGM